MSAREQKASGDDAVPAPCLDYLQRRVREEAEAAVRATSMPATLIHVALATAYAKRFGEVSHGGVAVGWADEHRLW
jgi:hypothetical protein